MQNDPGETQDLSEREAALLEALIAEYQALAAEVGVAELPSDYSPVKQAWINAFTEHPFRFSRFVVALALDAYPWLLYTVPAVLIAFMAGTVVVVRRRWRS